MNTEALASLEAQARANRRSLEGENRDLLLSRPRRRVEDFRERMAQLCALSAHTGQTDSGTLLREDRAR